MAISSPVQRLRVAHTKIMIGVVGAVCLLGLAWEPTLSKQLLLLVAGVGTIGLAHGAMDHRVGELLLRKRFKGRWMIVFGAFYLTLAAAFFLVWAITPGVALSVFLIYSAFHFGFDHREEGNVLTAISRGSLPILLPIAFHRDDVSRIFSYLAGSNIEIAPFSIWISLALVAAASVSIVHAIKRRSVISAAETILLVILNYTTPPLLAFAVYFVLLHSVRHLIELAGWLEPTNLNRGFFRIARESLPLTILTAVGMSAAVLMLGTPDFAPAVLKVLFVTLSALTIPHMIITHVAARNLATS